jgi:hypothetical protein
MATPIATAKASLDHRLAYVAHVCVLAVRFGLIAGLDQQYREDRLARGKLTRHAARIRRSPACGSPDGGTRRSRGRGKDAQSPSG